MCRRLLLMSFLIIFLAPKPSNASLIRMLRMRDLANIVDHQNKTAEVSPSPSPAKSLDFHSNNSSGPSGGGSINGTDTHAVNSTEAESIGSVTDERCDTSTMPWCTESESKVIACMSYAGPGSQGPFLLFQNDGGNSLEANWTFLPANITSEAMQLPPDQAKKVYIPTNVVGSQSIVINARNGSCTIHIGSTSPENNSHEQTSSYANYVTHVYGAYLLGLAALMIGGTWACCKFGKEERHLDGVPYQELEMGQPESFSAINEETIGGWDESWDDDWDEENAVNSQGRKHLSNGQANGFSSRPASIDGWGNTWDE